jgi:hypothetical protein
LSERIASLWVEISAKIEGLLAGLHKTKTETESAGTSLSSLAGEAAKMSAGLTAAGLAVKQVFEFGEMGAQVLQVEQSFQALLQTVGGAPNTLDQMRAAVQGTASDMQLMSSASTFLAGTTGELGSAFADALPELAGVARAAAILNPTLGGAGEAFNRLALGIKKAEPELLDEVGILLNLNQVYAEFAPTVGKTADQLTKTEKSMAMLNAVLEQGGTLMEQAGNAANDTATKIDQMQAATENAGNAIKATLAPAIASAASSITYLLTSTQQINDALNEHAGAVANTSSTYGEYIAELERAAQVAGYSIDANGNLVETFQDMGYTVETVVQANYALSESEWLAAKSASAQASALDTLSGGLSILGENTLELTNNATDLAEGWDATSARMTAAAEAAGMTAITMDQLHIMAVALAAGLEGTLGEAMTNYSENLAGLTTQEAELTAELERLQAAGLSPTSEKYAELTAALAENKAAQEGALAGLQSVTAEMIYQQAAMGLDTQAALDLARSMGVLSETDYAVASAVESLRQEFDQNGDSMISAAEGASRYAASVDLVNRAVQSLQAKGLPVTLDNIAAEMASLAQTDASGELENTASAAGEAASPLVDVAGASTDAASGASDLASNLEDQNGALEAVSSAANRARGGLDTVRGAASSAVGPLRSAANAADDLASALSGIRANTRISVSTSGFAEAIRWVDDLASAIDGIPSSVTASIHLNTSGGGSSGGSSGGSGGGQGGIGGGGPPTGPHSTVINNIYNPLAAAMILEQQRQLNGARLEARMNG